MISAHQSAQGVPPTSSAAATATAAAAAEEAKYAILQLLFIPGRKMKYNVPCVEGKKTRMHICGAVAQGAPQRMQEPIFIYLFVYCSLLIISDIRRKFLQRVLNSTTN